MISSCPRSSNIIKISVLVKRETSFEPFTINYSVHVVLFEKRTNFCLIFHLYEHLKNLIRHENLISTSTNFLI